MSRDRSHIEHLASQVVDSAMRVHVALGPGLLERAYEACLARELRWRGIAVQSQVPLPVTYRGEAIDLGYRLDLLVGGEVIVELKAVARSHPVHKAQILSYLKLSGHRIGFLINFHSPRLKDGIERFVRDL